MVSDLILYHNPIYNWLTALTIAGAIYLVMRFGKMIAKRRLDHLSKKSTKDWDDLIVLLIDRIHSLFLLALGVYAGSLILELPLNVSYFFKKGIFVILLFQSALIGSQAINFLIERYRHQKIESNAAAVTTLSSVSFVLKTLLWFILLLLALDAFGVNVTALVAGLGISGIAVALAVQNILGDLFASFSIVFDKPFVIGDFIIVGDFLGTVEYVGLKTTRVRSLSGEQLIFSNGDLLSSRIRNFKRMYERRVVFSIGVLYQTQYEHLIEIPKMIQSIIESQSPVRFDRAHFKEYGAYSLNFEVVYWIQNPDYNVYMDIQQIINLSIFKQFKDKGIKFAYPTQTVFVQNDLSQTFNSQSLNTDADLQSSLK
ncbi:MAG: mechanosensitive ion channel family protein [Deltaproteobacteria bacterium]|nr:mechanosensitive ion channel family protein [Deltaproteobacteria bacterium]